MYLFKRLTAVSAAQFYQFEHIVSYSSGKVVGKVSGYRISFEPLQLREGAFAGGLLRRERVGLTLCVGDRAFTARKPGEAGDENHSE